MVLRWGANQPIHSLVAMAIEYATDNGAKVINLSTGWMENHSDVETAVDYAADAGVLIVAAAGNNGDQEDPSILYPARLSNTLAVGATDQDDERLSDSSYGYQLDVVAPGTDIYTTDIMGSPGDSTGDYIINFGKTSAATPHVAGLAALIRSLNPSLTWQQVRETIRLSADKVAGMGGQNFTHEYGYGRINANKAVHNLYVPQVYATIQSAINAAVSGQTVLVSSGTYYGNFSMKSGVDVIGNGRSGGSATVISGNVTFPASTSYSDLTYLQTTGSVTMTSTTNCDLYNVWVFNGITLNNADYTVLGGVRVSKSGVSPVLDLNEVDWVYIGALEILSAYNYGIYAHNNSGLEIWPSQINNTNYGIYLADNSLAYATAVEFCDNDPYDIWANNYANAYYCVWSYYPNSCTHNTNYIPLYDYEICGMRKTIVADRPTPPAPVASEPGMADFEEALDSYWSIRQDMRAAVESGARPEPQDYAAEFAEVIGQLKGFVSSYPNSRYAGTALGLMTHCYWAPDEPESLAEYLAVIVKGDRYAALKPYARNLQVSQHLRTGDNQTALELSDTILSNLPPADLAVEVLYNKGVIYRYYLDDLDNAVAMYQAAVAEYPDHPTAQLAAAKLEELGADVPEGSPAEPEAADELALEGYPNPFNPTATIRFGLPEGGNVTLVVYDLMGREVVRLVEGHREAGWRAIVWDGRDARGRAVPTGIYIARLSIIPPTAGATSQETRAIKLVMMK